MGSAAKALAAGLACFAIMASAAAADTVAGELAIKDPWARSTVGDGAGAAYLTIDNTGAKPDRLTGASSPVAKTTELHTHVRDGDVMRMRRVDAIEVPAKATTTLQPGGLHVMFLGLAKPLAAGGSFPLTLRFAEAGEVTVTVNVKDMAAMTGGDAGHGAMDHHHGGMEHHGKPAESGY